MDGNAGRLLGPLMSRPHATGPEKREKQRQSRHIARGQPSGFATNAIAASVVIGTRTSLWPMLGGFRPGEKIRSALRCQNGYQTGYRDEQIQPYPTLT